MLTVSAVSDVVGTSRYFAKDNYYTREEGIENSQWLGKGADLLGLNGNVAPEVFELFLKGQVDGQQLGRKTSAGIQHRAGWDLTFSAPKSLSILSEIYALSDLRDAHNKAVIEAINFIEKEAIQTRLSIDGVVKKVHTGNAIIASFVHNTSRELEPLLHTHALFINATKTAAGWRSITNEKLLNMQLTGGMVYRAALAKEVIKRSYKIKKHRKHRDLFEIEGVPDSLIDGFSTRSKQIEAYFKENNIEYDTKKAKKIALITRRKKTEINQDLLKIQWKERSNKIAPEFSLKNTKLKTNEITPTENIRKLVQTAIINLSEKEMAFSELDIGKDALRFSLGTDSYVEIHTEIKRLISTGFLIVGDRKENEKAPLLTTAKAKEIEIGLINSVIRNKGCCNSLVDLERAQKFLKKTELNDQQKAAVVKAVISRDRFFAIQGDPGVGKTTTLNAYKKLLLKQGYDVLGLAPTYQALAELEKSLKIEGMTVDRYLADPNSGRKGAAFRKKVLILDEASMPSTEKINQLIGFAEQRDARIIFVGDHQQIESIDAGRGFSQLLKTGIDVAVMNKRLRQKNDHMKTVIDRVINKDYSTALSLLSKQGELKQHKVELDSIRELVNDYMSHQSRSDVLIVAPTHEQQKEINTLIREKLRELNEISKNQYNIKTLHDKPMSGEELKKVQFYEQGDVVRFSQAYKGASRSGQERVERNEYFTVVGQNKKTNVLALKSRHGARTIYVNPASQGGNIKGGLQVFKEDVTQIAKGDVVRWLDNKNDAKLKRNVIAKVLYVDSQSIRLQIDNKRNVKLRLDHSKRLHFQHSYSTTAYGAQGATKKEVYTLMQSWRKNTVNARSFLVAATRASHNVRLYVDSSQKLAASLKARSGDNTEALGGRELDQIVNRGRRMKNTL